MGAGGAHTVGQTVEAGLPNIVGTAGGVRGLNPSGAILNNRNAGFGLVSESIYSAYEFKLDASLASPIYGASDTVQPPAYFVNIWKRIA